MERVQVMQNQSRYYNVKIRITTGPFKLLQMPKEIWVMWTILVLVAKLKYLFEATVANQEE